MNETERTALVDELAEAMMDLDLEVGFMNWNFNDMATACLPIIDRQRSGATASGLELQTEITAWAHETFGPGYGFNDLHKLFDEMEELKRAALAYGAESQEMSDPESTSVANEAADVMHMLFQLAHNLGFDLLEETRKKFEINKQRTWRPQVDGTYQHVEERDQ